MSQADAQQRADRIRAFRDELRTLEEEGFLVLPPEEKQRVARHHDETLRRLSQTFDIDTTEAQKQMSWGMRIASFLGALALCASVYLFFYRFWGLIGTAAQVALVVAATLVAVAGTEFAARKERTLYIAGIV